MVLTNNKEFYITFAKVVLLNNVLTNIFSKN